MRDGVLVAEVIGQKLAGRVHDRRSPGSSRRGGSRPDASVEARPPAPAAAEERDDAGERR